MVRVSSLHVYPIKSLGGHPRDVSGVEPRGLRHDRRWMLVDEEGVFLSQRTIERMALFRVTSGEFGLRVIGPSGARFEVPFANEGERLTVRVWQSEVEAVRVSDAADAWFSAEMGQPARLVYMPDEAVREPNPQFSREGDRIGFSDAMPVLVAGESSLEDLNSRLESPIPMNRFRANIIVSGSEAYAEDGWREGFTLGGVRFRHAKHCGRCRVTTTDQETAVVGQEPLRALAKYRREGNNVIFGTYYIPEAAGVVSVGDELVFG